MCHIHRPFGLIIVHDCWDNCCQILLTQSLCSKENFSYLPQCLSLLLSPSLYEFSFTQIVYLCAKSLMIKVSRHFCLRLLLNYVAYIVSSSHDRSILGKCLIRFHKINRHPSILFNTKVIYYQNLFKNNMFPIICYLLYVRKSQLTKVKLGVDPLV